MNLEISDQILQQTTKCPHGFNCLTSAEYPQCDVERMIGNILSVKTTNSLFCSYRVNYGHGYFCTCPTRIEIYKRLGR